MSQISRITTWATIDSLTAASLNNEFNNIINAWNNVDSGVMSFTNLKISSTAKFPDGSAASPSITFTTDTTRGFYKSGSGIGVAVNGASILTFGLSSQFLLVASSSLNDSLIGWRTINTSAGTAAEAVCDVAAGTGGCGILSSGSGNADTYMGIAKANTSQFRSDSGGAGLFISTAGGGGPMYIGTSATLAASIDTSQQFSFKGLVNGSTASTNGAVQWNVTNSNNGTAAVASFNAVNDASNNLNFKMFGSGNTSTLYGITLANYGVLTNGSGSGLIINTNSGSMFIGTANTKAITIDTSQVVTYVNPPIYTALTGSTVPYLNSSKALTSSAVTPTELGYVSGVTSAIQTQLGLLAPKASPTFTGVITAAAGSVSAPAVNLGDAASGLYRPGTNQIGVAFNGVGAWRTLSSGSADATLYQPIEYFGGHSVSGVDKQSTITVTTAAVIYTMSSAYDCATVLVSGNDGSGNEFYECVNANGSTTAVFGTVSVGSPTARTYSYSSGNLRVAMAAGTYSISIMAFGLNKR